MGSFLLCAALLAAPSPSGGEAAALGFPATVDVATRSLVLNGTGVRTRLGLTWYRAALYVDAQSTDARSVLSADRPRRIVIQATRHIPKSRVVSVSTDAFEANAGDRMPALRERGDQFLGVLTAMAKDDTLEMTYRPGAGTDVAFNGKSLVTIAGGDFAEVLFSIWIGDHPVQESLKKALLGG